MRDPEMRTRTTVDDRRAGSNIGWIAGALVVLLLLGALAFTWNRDGDTTAGTEYQRHGAGFDDRLGLHHRLRLDRSGIERAAIEQPAR